MTDIKLTSLADGSTDAEIIEGNYDVTIHNVTIKGDASGPNPVDPPVDPPTDPVDPPQSSDPPADPGKPPANNPVDPAPVLTASFTAVISGSTVLVTDTSTPGATPITKVHFNFNSGPQADCGPGESALHDYPNGSQRRIDQTATDAAGNVSTFSKFVYPSAPKPTPIDPPPTGEPPTDPVDPAPPATDPPPVDPVEPPPDQPIDPASPPAPSGAHIPGFRYKLAHVSLRADLYCWPLDNGAQVQAATLDWGDGTGNPKANVNLIQQKHTYAADGIYTITVVATAADGSVGIFQTPVTVAQLAEPPDPGVTAEGVAHLTAVLGDGTTVDLTINKGERVPLLASDPARGSLTFYADGLCPVIDNMYDACPGDLTGHFKLNASGKVLFDGLLVIWKRARTRPFWIKQPTLLPNVDLSQWFPTYGTAGKNASRYAAYMAADNGPMGRGPCIPGIGTTGENSTLGPVREEDADYLANPSAENLEVVLGMGNSSSVWSFHVADSKTQKMIRVGDYPFVSTMYPGQHGNPILDSKSNSPLSLDQAWTHAPAFGALAAALTGANYYKDELAMWANFIGGLSMNPGYRSAAGCITTKGAARGKGRTLNVLLFAAKLSNEPEYFDKWVTSFADECAAVFPAQAGIQIDQKAAASEGYPHNGVALWQQDIEVQAFGHGIQCGYTGFQTSLDLFGEFYYDVMDYYHELFTTYYMSWKDASGGVTSNWKEMVQVTALTNPKVAAALKFASGSAELQTALGWPQNKPGDFYAGNPTAATGYPAQALQAYSTLARFGSNQPRAQAALAKFLAVLRVDFTNNPKYDIRSKTLAP